MSRIRAYTRHSLNFTAVLWLFASLLLAGCSDASQRHQVLSLLFDGVPAPPPPVEEICADYSAVSADEQASEEEGRSKGTEGSSHKPYAEKKCKDCHSQNKSVDAGLIAPKQELCLICHEGFSSGHNVHGPVAVGDCLACHLPHRSGYPSLLIDSPEKICSVCHQEDRLAKAMHSRFIDKRIGCGECHDPHSGDVRYFLK